MSKFLTFSILFINCINGMDLLKLPPLIEAVYNTNIEQIKNLSQRGIDLSQTDYHGRTACMYAAQKSLREILPLVCSNNVIDMQDNNGMTALMYAAETIGTFSLVHDILLYNPDVNKQNLWAETALMMMITNNNVNLGKLLIDKGAHINIQNIRKETALMIAVIVNNYDGVLMLLQNGADKKLINEDGKTALQLAQEHPASNLKIIKLLRFYNL